MSRTNIFEATVQHFLAPIMEYMRDETVAEIMVNSYREIYIERNGGLIRTEASFESEDALRSAVNNVLQYTGKRANDEHPLIDSRLPDGSRVHVILPPLCRGGTCMTIRKFAKQMFDAQTFVELGTWSPEAMDYMGVCVRAEKNTLVAGGTSSGKTSLLNVLSTFIPAHSRVVTIEDSAELELQQDHVISLEARQPDRWGRGGVDIRDLFRSSLRLRPDRIIIGETRGGEALDMIQAMTSGHAGSMSTLHANTALDTLNRLETLALMAKLDLPLYALRSQIASAIDMVILMARMSDGRRVVTEIAEVLPLDAEGLYQVQPMFEYRLYEEGQTGPGEGGLVWCGKKSTFAGEPKIRLQHGHMDLAKRFFEEE